MLNLVRFENPGDLLDVPRKNKLLGIVFLIPCFFSVRRIKIRNDVEEMK